MSRIPTGSCARAFSLLVLFGAAGAATAAAKVSVQVGRVEFGGLQIEDLGLDWTQAADAGGRIGVRAARIRGIGATGPLSAIAIDCANLSVSGNQLSCESGRLRGALGSFGAQNSRFSARTKPDGSLVLRLDAFALAGGRAKMDLRLDGASWQLESALSEIDIAAMARVAAPWFALPEGFTIAGRANGRVHATGRNDDVRSTDADLAIARLDFADASGEFAGEALAGEFRARLVAGRSGDFATDGKLVLTGGQAYSDPVFLDFAAHGMTADFEGILSSDARRFAARKFSLVHDGVASVSGSARLDFAGETMLQDGKLVIADLDLSNALPVYVQPYLIETSLKDLEGLGHVHGELDVAAGLPSRAALTFDDVTLDSQTGSLSVSGLGGTVNWFDDVLRSELAGEIDDGSFQSRMAWQSASLWGIEFGAVELPFATTGRHFRLLEPKLLPIFDGGLAINTLRLRHAGTDQMYLRFDAEVRPISVALLGRALGWPEFSGTISGSIPDLQLSQGIVTLGGNLEASVFDGRVVVRDLRLRDPLGKFPRLHASIDVDNLDLELVTNTFSFGMITGRLSGQVKDLETFDWMPEAFDASFYTPPGDKSKHRISQRAVTNLSSIGGGSGGGVAAALQGGFLKFFDSFSYDRLGLSCTLANDVCTMRGVENAPGGYYIVKGSGLPRINVIGSQSRVAWTRLVRQLGAIMESEIVVE
ncbi:MAG: hypothetical protein WBO00_01460 [Steroidobacteraceae bacterium]